MDQLDLLQKIIVFAVPIIFAITVHEVAHGFVANQLGDPTAKLLGRLTLNPIKHIDLIGTIAVPLILLLIPGVNFIFGWAKPVPIDWRNLRNPRRDTALVAVAGPAANALMALFWAGMLKVALVYDSGGQNLGHCPLFILDNAMAHPSLLLSMSVIGVMINLALLILNLLPLPPLDGSRIVSCLLPPRAAMRYNQLESFGFVIILILLFTNLLQTIILMPLLVLCDLLGIIFNW
jgi:Zn-dependent protease